MLIFCSNAVDNEIMAIIMNDDNDYNDNKAMTIMVIMMNDNND